MDRNDEPREIQKVGMPDYLAKYMEEENTSIAGMGKYHVVSRLDVTQLQYPSESRMAKLLQEYGSGAVVIPQTSTLVAGLGEPFLFVPCFFYEEWIQWRDRRDKGPDKPKVVERTFDPASDVARKAKRKETRTEIYPGGTPDKPFTYKFQEHLNFVGFIYAGEHKGAEVGICFSGGEHWAGTTFINQIQERRMPNGKAAHIWSTVWELRTSRRDGQKGAWYGFDARSHAAQPWVMPDEASVMRNAHLKLREEFQERRLTSDADVGAEATVSDDDEV